MLGMNLQEALAMAKPMLEKEGLKSVVIRLVPATEENPHGVEVLKYTKDIIGHVVQLADTVKTLQQQVEDQANYSDVSTTINNGIVDIVNSRKTDMNKVKAIQKLLSE